MRLASAPAKVNLIFSYSCSWSLSQLRNLNQHFPMAAALSVGTAEISFFLQRDRACFDRTLRFTDCCSKIFLRDRRIYSNRAKHSQFFQSAIQSAIFAL